MKDNIVRYSKVRNGMTKKDKRNYCKNNKTIVLDDTSYAYRNKDINYVDIDTLILENNNKRSNIYINDTYAKNVYVDTYPNLGGITIPYEYIIMKDSRIYFNWYDEVRNNININLVLRNKEIFPLCLNNVKDIVFGTSDETNRIYIEVKDVNSRKKYILDSVGNLEIKYISHNINNNTFHRNVLNLKELENYEEVNFNNFNLDVLVLNKTILKNFSKYEDLFKKVKFTKIIASDDNDMKLFQDVYVIMLDENDEVNLYHDRDYGYFIYIDGKNKKILYIDSKDKLKLIEEDKLIDENTCKNSIFLKHNMFYTNYEFIMISKLINNNIKITSFDKEYIIDDEFKKFLLINLDSYFSNVDYLKECIINDGWDNIIKNWKLVLYQLENAYNGFLEFKKRLDKLRSMGFTSDAINYLIDREIYKIVNNVDNDFDLDDLDKEEVSLYNKLGENHKVKTLRKSGDN